MLLSGLLLTHYAVAQLTVSGTVISSEDNSGMPGVNVVVQGTTSGTVTDLNGQYSINLESGNITLVYSFIGFSTQAIEVGNRTTIDVIMEPELTQLSEIVVIGYGTVRKSDLTGSVSSIKGAELMKIPSINAAQALQGKVPGVQVTSATGAPGDKSIVRIRGMGTFNNNDPIFVVDGVILNNIDFLNSGDIESMEVLKDASATAIYGSRGANGVIMITTKQGTMGQEQPTVNVTAEYSIQQLEKKIDLLNGSQFASIVNEIRPGSYNNVDLVPNTDWQDLIFRTAPIQNYQASVSGSTSKVQYYVGLGYFNQSGIIPKSNYQRFSLKLNNTYHITKNIKLGNNLTFTPRQQQNTHDNAVFVVYRAQPVIPVYQPDGSYSEVPGVGNVLADIEYRNSYENSYRAVGNFYGEITFLKDFVIKSSYGIDLDNIRNKSFTPVFYVSPQQQNSFSRLSKDFNNIFSWLWENTISFRKEIAMHRIDIVGGYTAQESSSEFLHLEGLNIIRDQKDFWYFDQNNISSGSTRNEVDNENNYSMISYLFRANYAFDNRYLFTATFRRDGSSKFNKANRFSDFPSFAIGWNIINEGFMSGITELSNLKLRASWGIIGNEKVNYLQIYSLVDNGINAVFGQNEVMVPGNTYSKSGNPDLRWENTYQTDIGLELGFFEDKLTAELDYFRKQTQDILIGLQVPGYLGNGSNARITYNAADVLNRGFELNLLWSGKIGNFDYRLGANGTTLHNETLKVSGSGGDDDYLPGIASKTEPGYPIGSFYGYQTDGIFQDATELADYPHRSDAEVGFLRYVDTNGDGSINGDDRVHLGSPIPTYLFGFNLNGSFKGFNLSIDIQGQGGNKIFNYKETVRPDLYNFEQHVFDRWTGPGTSDTEPRPTYGGYNWINSNRFIYDGAFIRLRSVTFGYTVPENLSHVFRMKTAQVYVRGTNLMTLAKFPGYSPEVRNDNPIDNGLDRGVYPIASVYSVGLNISF
jgi:TonB-linked SusC/RagA family outer membrane protein